MKRYKDYVDVDFQEKLVNLDTGIRMAYYEFGDEDGAPLVLLHGVTDGCVSWTQLIPGLTACGYHLYIMEYRGNGMTDKPDMGETGYTAELIASDVLNLMDKIGLQKTYLAGHSYGSMISQVLAAEAPERFPKCILINTGTECKGGIIDFARNGDGNFRGMYAYEGYFPADFCEEWMDCRNEDESFRTAVIEHLKQMPVVAFQNLINGLANFDSSGFLKNITSKVLVVWSTEDEVFPAEAQAKVKAGLTSCDVTYIDVEGASHGSFWDSKARAEEYVGIIDGFLKK